MINIIKSNNNLTLRYSTENTWVSDQLNIREDFSINKRNFIFLKRDILSINNTDGDLVDFSFGELNDAGYFYIKGRKLGIENDVYIHKSIDISEKIFIGVNNNSIFKAINKVVTQDIYIGGDQTDAIPVKDFFLLLKGFPNQYEVSKYIKDRLSAVLENYFDSAYLIRGKYESYMNKRNSIKGENLEQALKESEIIKYELIVEKLNLMLRNENKYNEKQWQIEILRIILLLYPKYIYAFDEAPVRDAYNSKKDKRIDFILIDSDGNVDIIEIKRPMNEKIITKTIHRGNYIPRQDLSSTVMQVEKYIYII